MDQNEFPPNSKQPPRRSTEKAKNAETEPKKIEPVITGEARKRKKSIGRRFTENFVQGDARSVWGYVTFDVMLPAAKDMIADAVSQGVERMIFGESRSASRRSTRPSSSAGHVNYNKMSQSSTRRDEPRAVTRQARANQSFDDIEIDTRAEAEEVIDRLFELIDRYRHTADNVI